jgi:hypothetical protein
VSIWDHKDDYSKAKSQTGTEDIVEEREVIKLIEESGRWDVCVDYDLLCECTKSISEGNSWNEDSSDDFAECRSSAQRLSSKEKAEDINHKIRRHSSFSGLEDWSKRLRTWLTHILEQTQTTTMSRRLWIQNSKSKVAESVCNHHLRKELQCLPMEEQRVRIKWWKAKTNLLGKPSFIVPSISFESNT